MKYLIQDQDGKYFTGRFEGNILGDKVPVFKGRLWAKKYPSYGIRHFVNILSARIGKELKARKVRYG